MSLSKIYSAQVNILSGQIVTIEVDVTHKTLYAFNVVGLPDKAVEEAKDRVSGAIKNSGFPSPKTKNHKIVVSLSPADLKKEGSVFDLPIALGYLLACEVFSLKEEDKIFLGELGLDGSLRSIKGVLPIIKEAKKKGFKEVYLPKANAKEASLVSGIDIFGVSNLKELIEHFSFDENSKKIQVEKLDSLIFYSKETKKDSFFSEIRGQENAKRGLEIAASGGHNIAMYGPPGTGKTMLARAFSEILPELEEEDVLEVTGIHSVLGLNKGDLILNPPFRSPHHTSSYVSIIGGGVYPKPGEVTLAHKGVLFLDEFPEFDKRVLESLRQPLEDSVVSISRAKGFAIFPANFILIAAMNPCPCGYAGSKKRECICKPNDLDKYKRKLSGPIIDRIDLWVLVSDVDYKKLSEVSVSTNSYLIKERVIKARNIQKERFKKEKRNINTNSEMNISDLTSVISLSNEVKNILNQSAEHMNLSPRVYHRMIKVARTIADIDGKENIEVDHILEALQFRPKISF